MFYIMSDEYINLEKSENILKRIRYCKTYENHINIVILLIIS